MNVKDQIKENLKTYGVTAVAAATLLGTIAAEVAPGPTTEANQPANYSIAATVAEPLAVGLDIAAGVSAAVATPAIIEAELAVAMLAIVPEVLHDAGVPIIGTDYVFGPAGMALLKAWEGLELTGYILGDGMCTIGYGHAEPLHTVPDCTSWTITEAEAEALLAEDIQIYAAAVADHFTRPLNQHQFDALTVFTYNVGVGVYEKYGWATDPDDARITGNMGLYVFPAQFREGLTARRAAEVELFNTPHEAA